MQRKDIFILENITDFCRKIQKVYDGIDGNFAKFNSDYEKQDLVAFYLLQIGELSNRLSDAFIEQHPEIEWHKIVALRNIVAHEYGNVSPEIIWDTIKHDIPNLQNFCHETIR